MYIVYFLFVIYHFIHWIGATPAVCLDNSPALLYLGNSSTACHWFSREFSQEKSKAIKSDINLSLSLSFSLFFFFQILIFFPSSHRIMRWNAIRLIKILDLLLTYQKKFRYREKYSLIFFPSNLFIFILFIYLFFF